MRIQPGEVEAATFSPKKDVVDYKPVSEVVFTVRGEHDYMFDDIPAMYDKGKTKAENRSTACAKKVGHRHFIKINNRGDIFNPLDNTHLESSDRKENNIPVWKYVSVAYTTFCHYIYFLKTRNQNFLTLAKRDLGSVV